MGLHSAFATMPIRSKCNYITMRFKKSALCFLNFLCGHIRCWTQPCPFHLPSGNSRPEITWTFKTSILPVYRPYTGITKNSLQSDQAKPCKPCVEAHASSEVATPFQLTPVQLQHQLPSTTHTLDTISECPWWAHWHPHFCKHRRTAWCHQDSWGSEVLQVCSACGAAEQKSSPSSRAACNVPSWSRRHSWCQGRGPGWKQDFPKAPAASDVTGHRWGPKCHPGFCRSQPLATAGNATQRCWTVNQQLNHDSHFSFIPLQYLSRPRPKPTWCYGFIFIIRMWKWENVEMRECGNCDTCMKPSGESKKANDFTEGKCLNSILTK